jgi:spore coat protein U-like protein
MFRALGGVVAFLLAGWALQSAASAAPSSNGRAQKSPPVESCRASITAFSFGTYSPLMQTGRLAQTFVSFNCPRAVAEIDLDPGVSGDFGARRMTPANGSEPPIAYNIYLDAARTIVFGDGAAGTSAYVPPSGTSQGSFPLYAEIAPGQSRVDASAYSDTLNITIRMVL